MLHQKLAYKESREWNQATEESKKNEKKTSNPKEIACDEKAFSNKQNEKLDAMLSNFTVFKEEMTKHVDSIRDENDNLESFLPPQFLPKIELAKTALDVQIAELGVSREGGKGKWQEMQDSDI